MLEDLAAVRTPAPPALDEARVYWADLDIGIDAARRRGELLDAHEKARAARFYFKRDAIRFVAGRAVLRTLLGEALGIEAAAIAFTYGPHGKPELAAPFIESGLRFNTSNSDGLGVFAIVRGRRIGVDIERVRALRGLDAIAERTYSPRERADLRALPEAEREAAFFRCWTRKEAFIKAIGEGLSHPLDRFTVSLAPDSAARLLESQSNASEPWRWTLESLSPPSGYVGALAIEGPPVRVVGRGPEDQA